jgi:predicted dehydrogenase
MHVRFGCEVLKANQHLMMEKPLARTAADAERLVQSAAQSEGIVLVGHCMRFWPGWTWLRDAIQDGRFGKVHAATFHRRVNHPGGPFYSDGARSGGAALDLHIHDTDFVQYCFGMPQAVTSFGYSKITSEPDHLVTHYQYADIPLVMAEGSWAMADGYTFNMGYTVNFERATAVYDSSHKPLLMLYEPGKAPAEVPVENIMGYDLEIGYLLDCIQQGLQPTRVTVQDAWNTLRIIEAEVASVRSGQTVTI